jgi:phosphoribosylpyrophosphate synthetase
VTEPAPRTVASVSAPYANFLCPLPPAVAGVCQVCRSNANPGYDRCMKCDRSALVVGRESADAVGFVALAPEEGRQRQLAKELYAYKGNGASLRLTTGLGAVLWRWREKHEGCLARACGVDNFDVVTTVPSSSSSGRVGPHPLVRVVSGVVRGSADDFASLLRPSGVEMDKRDFRADRFVAEDCEDLRVLLIDDAWTTGAKMLGAAAALKAAGATAVGALAIGRWYHPADRYNTRVEEARAGIDWSWDTCMFCAS